MKKLLCIVLSLAMILSLGLTAFAVEYGDVPADHYAAGAISRWSGYGVVQGSDGRFNPGGDLKRSESAQVLANLLKLTDTAGAKSFPDVTEDKWFKGAVDLVSAAGISNGDDHGMFNPDNSISRQEFFVMFARGLALEPQDTTGGVSAADAAEWAKGYINALTDKGYVRGNLDGVNPLANITRAEVMALMDQTISVYAYEYGETYTGTGEKIALVVGNSVVLTGEFDDVIVQKSNALTLKDAKINGELVLNDAATTVTQEGDTTVKNVKNNAGATIEDGIAPTPTPTPTPTSTPSSGGSSPGGTTTVAPPRGDVYDSTVYNITYVVLGDAEVVLNATSGKSGDKITATFTLGEGAVLSSAKDDMDVKLLKVSDTVYEYTIRSYNTKLTFVFEKRISDDAVGTIKDNAAALSTAQADKITAPTNTITATTGESVKLIEEITIDTSSLNTELDDAAKTEEKTEVKIPVEVTLATQFTDTEKADSEVEATVTGVQFLNALLGSLAPVSLQAQATDTQIEAYVNAIMASPEYLKIADIVKTADNVNVSFKGGEYNKTAAVGPSVDAQARVAVNALVKTILEDMAAGYKPSKLVDYINHELNIVLTINYLNVQLVMNLTVK